MKQVITFKLSPSDAEAIACSNGRIEQALAYLAASVNEAGGVAELTIIIQRKRLCKVKQSS